MKKILYALAAFVLASCATAPAPAPVAKAPVSPAAQTPQAAPAPKEVKYEEALPTLIRSFYPNGDPSGSQVIQYNAQEQLVRQETYNGNGVLAEVRTGAAKGGVWRITVTNAQSGEVTSFEDLTLGPKGETLVQTFLNPKEVPQASNEYSYDAQGHKVSWLAKTGAGGLQARTVYTYDKQGNNTKTEVYDAGGKLANVFQSTYDDQNRILTRQGSDQSGNLVEDTNFTWNGNNKIKEETTKPLLRSTEYTYGDKSAPTAAILSVRGKVVERQTFEYRWFTKTKLVSP
jgi:hypothetical protein